MRQYFRDEPTIDANGNITDFPDNNNSIVSFKCKTKIEGRTKNDGAKDVK